MKIPTINLKPDKNKAVKEEKDGTSRDSSGERLKEKVYTYDEAIGLAGNGFYIFSMLVVLTCAFSGMALDMFGFAIVVSSACDLNLSHEQKGILLSMPFLGPVVMAYPWGYISDTKGRLRGLLLALWGSFMLAVISSFSPNWIVLAILKFGSSSCSSGVQSLSFTLLGESCSPKYKGAYLIGVATIMVYTFAIYSTIGYFILNLDFAIVFGSLVYTPWRLFVLVLAMPLGVAAVFMCFFYESPKFLLNDGCNKQALDALKKISKRNGVKAENYPVTCVVLNETTTVRKKDVPLLKSLMDQTLPLFKPPLLYRTLQLFYITAVIYSSNNGFLSWLPFVADSFISGYSNNGTVVTDNLCSMLSYSNRNTTHLNTCIPTVQEFTLWIGLIQGVAFSVLNLAATYFSSRKKTVLMLILSATAICGFSTPLVHGRILTISLFYGFLLNALAMAVIFSYYVDVFPTSYRGMASCLGVMMSRLSALAGTSLVGTYLVSHCASSFYSWSAFLLSGVIVCGFLPSDKPKIDL